MYNFAYVFYLSSPGPITLVKGNTYNCSVILYTVAHFFLHLSHVPWNCLIRHQFSAESVGTFRAFIVVENALSMNNLDERYSREGENWVHTSFFLRKNKSDHNN